MPSSWLQNRDAFWSTTCLCECEWIWVHWAKRALSAGHINDVADVEASRGRCCDMDIQTVDTRWACLCPKTKTLITFQNSMTWTFGWTLNHKFWRGYPICSSHLAQCAVRMSCHGGLDLEILHMRIAWQTVQRWPITGKQNIGRKNNAGHAWVSYKTHEQTWGPASGSSKTETASRVGPTPFNQHIHHISNRWATDHLNSRMLRAQIW